MQILSIFVILYQPSLTKCPRYSVRAVPPRTVGSGTTSGRVTGSTPDGVIKIFH